MPNSAQERKTGMRNPPFPNHRAGAASQAWIPTGEQSLLLTHIAATESVSLFVTDEKLTAFAEFESPICACGELS
jgi:hypothetical protein